MAGAATATAHGGNRRRWRFVQPVRQPVATACHADGQYVLPLPGVRRTRPRANPRRRRSPVRDDRSSGTSDGIRSAGRQLTLPLGDDWPENKPVLGRDGQYRLPLDVKREPLPPASPAGAGSGDSSGRAGRGRQLELPFDPYKGNRANRGGQYPLPLDGVRRAPAPKPAPATTGTASARAARGKATAAAAGPAQAVSARATDDADLQLTTVTTAAPPARPSRKPRR